MKIRLHLENPAEAPPIGTELEYCHPDGSGWLTLATVVGLRLITKNEVEVELDWADNVLPPVKP